MSLTVINHPASDETLERLAEATERQNTLLAAIATGVRGLTATVEATSTASKAYVVGDYFVYNGLLYKCTAAIAKGGTITPGTNCTATTAGAEISTLSHNLGAETTRAEAAETDLSNTIKALGIAGVAIADHTGVARFDSRFSQPPMGNYWYLFFRNPGDTSNNNCLLLAFTMGDAANNTVNYKWSIKSGVLINNVVSF